MVINRDVVKNVPLCCYGFIIFLVVNVYLLWGVALPASHAQTLCDYDAIIQPFRFGASGTMAIVPLLVLVAELSANRIRKILRTMLLPCAALGSVLGLLFSWASPSAWIVPRSTASPAYSLAWATLAASFYGALCSHD